MLVSGICVNTVGSYTCQCLEGFLYDPVNSTCSDIDECTAGTSKCHQHCINAQGSYYCDCIPGFSLAEDKITCDDIDECKQSNHLCQQRCSNTAGSYTCSCYQGYSLALNGNGCLPMDCGMPQVPSGISVSCDGTTTQFR